MAGDPVHSIEHEVMVGAPAQVPYQIIADVTAWPHLFPPTVHAEREARGATEERIKLWALANGQVRAWTSRRSLDLAARTITFQQEVTAAPVAEMSGRWTMQVRPDGHTAVRLGHTFRAIDDDPGGLAWIQEATDKNSTAELAAVKMIAEQHAQRSDLVLTFADSVVIESSPARAYAFIYRCQDWPARLPHVDRVDLAEPEPGIQRMEMDTRTPSGDVHTTTSFRICFAETKIVYKQVVLPPVMTAHTGQWLFSPCGAGTKVTSSHTVVINPARVAEMPGAATLAEARQQIQAALSANSRATLQHAKQHAEGR
jgi:ribosome-associated toxin RatA of RatAB toxin-antitoxin module